MDGKYEIRSLYFDNMEDKALREKLDGISVREKYRLRMYNGDTSVIRLERKVKNCGLGDLVAEEEASTEPSESEEAPAGQEE